MRSSTLRKAKTVSLRRRNKDQELPQIPVVVFLKFVFKNFVPIVAEIYHLSSVFCCVLHKINILFCFAQMPSIAEAIAK